MSRIRTILSVNSQAGSNPVAPGGSRQSSPEGFAPVAIQTVVGDGVCPIDIIVTVSADQNGVWELWQSSDPLDFAAFPGVPPAATRVITTGPIGIVANTPQTVITPFAAPVIALQYRNTSGAIVNELRLWSAVRFR